VGPAIGGVLYGTSPSIVYLAAATGCAVAGIAAAGIGAGRGPVVADARAAPGIEMVLEGLRFVRRTEILLGVILLDLLAVLFGGAVALLPIFASRYLHVGASGLGVLRAAPAIGALIAAAVITRRPIRGSAGRLLLFVVAVFGASIIVFGFSRSFVLSLFALGVSGYADLYSMNIRSTIDALATPDRLRGRVGAVEMVLIPAVVGGGCMTIAIAFSWVRLFPSIARIDRLDEITPAAETAAELVL
jgi:hypothetical protein